MSHLEAALRRAIAGLDPSDREARRIALGNVRASMMRLLAVYEPPLTTGEIEGKVDELDTLIAEIEAEFAPPLSPSTARAGGAASGMARETNSRPHAGARDDRIEEEDDWSFAEDEPTDAALQADPDTDLYSDRDMAFEDDEAIGDEDLVEDDVDAAPPQRQPLPRLVIAIAVAIGLMAGAAVFIALSPHKAGGPGPSAVAEAETPSASDAAPAGPSGQPTPTDTDEAARATPSGSDSTAASSSSADVGAETGPTAGMPPSAPAASTASASATVPAETPVAPPPGPAASESMIVFDGHDPSAFRTTADNPVRFEGDASSGNVRISSSPNSNGARLTVGPGVYQRLAGRTIRVVVVAKAAPDSPAANIRMAYLSGRKLSDWTDQALGKDYRSLSMTWTVPTQRAGKQDDAVLIEPGIPGDQTAVDIRSVTIDLLP